SLSLSIVCNNNVRQPCRCCCFHSCFLKRFCESIAWKYLSVLRIICVCVCTTPSLSMFPFPSPNPSYSLPLLSLSLPVVLCKQTFRIKVIKLKVLQISTRGRR